MQRETALAVCALATLAASTGCSTERSLDGSYRESGFVAPGAEGVMAFPDEGNLDILSSTLRGTLGGIAVDDSARATGFLESGYTTVYTSVDEAENGAVMTIVDVTGGLDHPSFVPGARLNYQADAFYDVDDEEAFVSIIGCSGVTTGAWDFDSAAESVSITIDEGSAPDTMLFTYTAQFNGVDTNIVTGSFETAR